MALSQTVTVKTLELLKYLASEWFKYTHVINGSGSH